MPDAAPIRVTSNDPDLATWLSAWLEAMRLDPPAPLTMAVSVLDALSPDDDSRPPFLQPLVEIRAGPPQRDVRIRWLAGPATARIAETTAHITLTTAALADRERLAQTFLTAVLVFLLRRADWHHVHGAAARDPKGREWLFAGNSQSGKSTTAALLATHGWGVGADDLTFLTHGPKGVEAVAQRAPIALRPGGHTLLALAGGASARGGRKTAYFPEELGGAWAGRVTPQILVFPRVEGELTRIESISHREALTELVRWSAWVALEPDLAQHHLDLLGALAQQTRGYRVALGPDLFQERDLMLDLVP
jgi:hypothetical protein